MDRRDFLKRGGAVSVGATMGATLGVSDAQARTETQAAAPSAADAVFTIRMVGDDHDYAVARTAARFAEDVEMATNGRIRIVVADGDEVIVSEAAAGTLEIGPVSAFAHEHDGWSALSPLGIGPARDARTWVLVGGGAALVQQIGLVHGWRAHLIGEVEDQGDPAGAAATHAFVVARFSDAQWLAMSPGDHAAVAAVATASLARGAADVDYQRQLAASDISGTPHTDDVARVSEVREENRRQLMSRGDPLAVSILAAFDAWQGMLEEQLV
ncbi:MAG: twin-arginine translocation signal domain-containing protein [Pseudomonadota bacterium]